MEPLFNIKSMVLFANREPHARTDLAEKYGGGFPGQRIAAKLPTRDVSLSVFEDYAKARKVQWRLQALSLTKGGAAKTTMFTDLARPGNGISASHYQFPQGATMFPRNFCFVESMEQLSHQEIAECGVPMRVHTADRAAKKNEVEFDETEGQCKSRSTLFDRPRRAFVSIPYCVFPPCAGSSASASVRKRCRGKLMSGNPEVALRRIGLRSAKNCGAVTVRRAVLNKTSDTPIT